MSITQESIWAGQPSTIRGTAVHLSYDPKSDKIAYASRRSVILRSVKNPEQTVQYSKHTSSVTVAKFAPSGFYVASADDAGNVKIWDCVGEDMVTKGEFQVISGRVNDLSWDADSQRIIAVGDGKERFGHCFTADSGNSVGEIAGHTEVVNAVAIRPCRPYRAATVGDDGNLVFYQGPPFKFDFTSRDKHNNFVHDVKFSPDGVYLVSVGADKKIVIYDGKTGEYKDTIDNAHEGGIFGVAWSADSKSVVTCSADGSVKMHEVESKKATQTWSLPKSLGNQQVGVVFAGEQVISLTHSGDLYYWAEGKDEPIKVVYGHQMSINGVTNGDKLYTGSADGRLCAWNQSSASLVGGGHDGQVVTMASSSNASWSIGWDDTLKKLENGKITKSTKLEGQPIGVDSTPNGLTVVATESTVALYDNGEKKTSVSVKYCVTSVAISADYVAVGDQNGLVHLLKVSDLSESAELPQLRAAPSYNAFSPNGEHLAVGDRQGKITLYSVKDKTVITSRWTFHTAKVTSINWHSSGQYVASGSLDTNIYVYSVVRPAKKLSYLGAHVDGVNGVAWTSDNTVASVGADATIKHWKVELIE